MSAYVVALVTITDREKYTAYEQRFMSVLAPYDGEVLSVEDAPRVLEGSWPAGRTVLLRFPDEAAARRWYDSPAYQEIARDRRAASNGTLAILSGLGVSPP
jgi:uncharacterized protein (DUF1330 family)